MPAPAPVSPRISGATSTGGAVTTTDTSGFTPDQIAAFDAAAKLAPAGSVVTQGPAPGANMPPPPPPPQDPTPKPVTAISSDQGAQYASENTQKLQTLKNTGLTVGPDGLARYSDQTFAPAPADAVQNPETGAWTSGGVSYAIGPATTDNPDHQYVLNQIATMKSQFDDTSRAMMQNIQDQFTKLIAQQTDVNKRGEASLGQSLLMAGSSRYAPVSSTGQMTSMMSYGLSKIGDLNTQEQDAITKAQQAQDTGDMKFMDMSLAEAQKARESKQKEAQTLSDALVKANKEIQDAKKASTVSSNIANIMAGGETDPAKILKALRDQGDTTTTADDVGKAIKALTPEKAKGDTFSFSQTQASQLYAAGLTPADVKVLQDYYNGKGDPSVVANLTPEHSAALFDALNGTASKKAASTVPSYAELHPKAPAGSKPAVSGSLSYTADTLGKIQSKILATKGTDGYVDPYVYKDALDAWTADGGLAKDFIAKLPVKNYINPAASWMPQYIASKTSKSSTTSSSIANPFQ